MGGASAPSVSKKEKKMAKERICPNCKNDEIDLAGRCVSCQYQVVRPTSKPKPKKK